MIKFLICGNNWLHNLHVSQTQWAEVGNGLFDFNAGKTQLASFGFSNNSDIIDLKKHQPDLDE